MNTPITIRLQPGETISQALIEEFEKGDSVRHGIANVLTYLASAFDVVSTCDAAATLHQLATELNAPSVLSLALAGDKDAARRFLYEAGITDKHGQLLPPYQSEELNNLKKGLSITTETP